MRSKPLPSKTTPGERVVKDIRRATRRHFSAEDKIRIVPTTCAGASCDTRRQGLTATEDSRSGWMRNGGYVTSHSIGGTLEKHRWLTAACSGRSIYITNSTRYMFSSSFWTARHHMGAALVAPTVV